MFAATGGPLGAEVTAALYRAGQNKEVVNYLYGLGGRDITVTEFEDVYNELERMAETHEVRDNFKYIGLRE